MEDGSRWDREPPGTAEAQPARKDSLGWLRRAARQKEALKEVSGATPSDLQGLGASLGTSAGTSGKILSPLNGKFVADLEMATIPAGSCRAVAQGHGRDHPTPGLERKGDETPGREGHRCAVFPLCLLMGAFFSRENSFESSCFTSERFNGCAQGPESASICVTESADEALFQGSAQGALGARAPEAVGRGAGIPQPLPACPGVPVPGATPQGRAHGAGAYLGVLWMLLALWRIWERSHEVVAGTEFLRRSRT